MLEAVTDSFNKPPFVPGQLAMYQAPTDVRGCIVRILEVYRVGQCISWFCWVNAGGVINLELPARALVPFKSGSSALRRKCKVINGSKQ